MEPHSSKAEKERQRLAALRDYRVSEVSAESRLDQLTELAAQICGTPMALIGFLDAHQVWLKATVGLEATVLDRKDAICTHVVEGGKPLVIEDLQQETQFAGHPWVCREGGVRFYAGVPLISPAGTPLGGLCVLDTSVRHLAPAQLEALAKLASQVVTHLELRRNVDRLEEEAAHHRRTEAMLREAENRFRSIFENSTEGIFQTTPDGHYQEVNPRLAQIYGYASTAELKASIQDIAHELYVEPGRREEFGRLMREHGEVVGFESQIYRRDGRVIWISENARSVLNAQGELEYYEGSVVDITDRKQTEQALRDSEVLYHSLVEYLPQNVFRKDTEGRFTFVNPLFAQTMGRAPEAILGKRDEDFFPPNLAASYRADDRHVMRTGRPLDKVENHVRSDGTRLYVHVLKTPLKDAEGNVIGVQGIFWDETERHQMEQQLAHERDLFAALLDNLPDAIYFKDRESHFLRCSRSLANRFGVPDPEALVGQSDFDFFTREHAQQAYDDEQEIIRTGEPMLGVTEKETWPDGHETWMLTTKMPFRDQTGAIIGTFGVSKDITKLIEIERELEQARDAALASTKAKSKLLGNITHELRTPLHTIIAGADVLGATPLKPEQREILTAMRRQADWQLRMINDLIELSRAATHSLKLDCHDFDPEDIVADSVERMAESALQKGIELIGDVEPGLPRVHGDPFRLQQILINLMANAIKFTDEGYVLVRVRLAPPVGERLVLAVDVQDTGIGISPTAQGRIFEAFEQADDSTTRKYGGTGLGLAICRELVELMGGQLDVRSAPGYGACFGFTVRLEAATQPAHDTPRAEVDLGGLRLLLVEDHEVARKVLRRRLEHWGCLVREAASAEEARAALAREGQFAAVLVDETLPDSPGQRLARELQPQVEHVALMASMACRLDLAAAGHERSLPCVPKPPPPRRLRRLLEAWQAGLPGPATEEGETAVAELGRPLRVLVAEDNDFNREIALQQLELVGHRAAAVGNGKEVLTEIERDHYDVLLLDCQMPELDGYATARAIRASEAARASSDEGRPSVYIVAVTANSSEEDRARCLRAGMDDFLSKPVVRATLDAALRRAAAALSQRSRREAAWPPPGVAATTLPSPTLANEARPPSAEGRGAETPEAAADQKSEPDAELPTLDLTLLRSFSPDAARNLARLFVQTADALIERLGTAVAGGDAPALHAAAHSLKGSSRHLGARRLGDLSAQIEALGRTEKLAEAAPLVEALAAEYRSVKAQLRAEPGLGEGE